MKPPLLASTTLLAALVWTVAMLVDRDPFTPASALLVGIGLLTMATVASIGMIVVGGRWAHRLGVGALAATIVVALVREIDVLWFAGMAAAVLGVVAMFSPTLTDTIRQLPSASGPPPHAVAPALLLVATPVILGFVGQDATPWALLVVGLTAPLVGFLYSRVLPGGLLAVRLFWPVLALALTPLLGWVTGVVTAGLALTLAVLAWSPSVKASYHPPREVGTIFPIPPELTPEEILDAAEIDDKGRRK